MKVQLVYFDGCPNVDAARAAVRTALMAENVDAPIEEIDVGAPSAPAWARAWGSPTILIDGQDVTGQRPSTSSSCRLYDGGSPSIDVIRQRIALTRTPRAREGRKLALPMVGAITAALAASACCLVPLVLAGLGLSGAGFATRLAPLRPYFLAATALGLAAGFWFTYRPRRDACGCAAPRSRRAARIGLWGTTVVAVLLAGYPLLGSGRATAGSSEAAAKATLRLTVTGMDCEECTGTIAKRIKRVPGVVSASVDFESGIAVVRHDGRPGIDAEAIRAVEDAGFRAAPRL